MVITVGAAEINIKQQVNGSGGVGLWLCPSLVLN